MKNNQLMRGHLFAFITICIWGTTFISTKVLLEYLTPIEILFMRFIIGYIALWFACPKILKIEKKKEELYFIGAGICGITLYYLLENIALTYTLASNVGVIISVAPFFTAILGYWMLDGEHPKKTFYIGFIVAMIGICLISFQKSTVAVNPIGDLLALLAAMIWAMYSTLTKKVSYFGYSTIQSTRRIFMYGLIFMIPVIAIMGFDINVQIFSISEVLFNIIFLGLGASALCFVTWNSAVKLLGTVKTSVYIYMVPVITTITSVVVLHEPLSFITIIGIVLTIVGLLLSEWKKV